MQEGKIQERSGGFLKGKKGKRGCKQDRFYGKISRLKNRTAHSPCQKEDRMEKKPYYITTAIAYSELYGKEIRYCSNRKEIKDHGDTGILLGSKLKDGDRVVIIEDVTTSGKSIEETFPIIKAQADVTIVGLIVSLNRMERGLNTEKCALDEIKETYGINTAAIVSMADVTEALYNKEVNGEVIIDDTIKAAIDKYYEEYGAK